MRLLILIILILLVVGALPAWPYTAGWGYYPVGGLGTILIISFNPCAGRRRLAPGRRLERAQRPFDEPRKALLSSQILLAIGRPCLRC
jgi:hypothetical protein